MSPSPENVLAGLIADVAHAPDELARRESFSHGFRALRAALDLHPRASRASLTFESAARTASVVAADSLPLGLALVMHLYPLCALRCVSLPWWSPAHAQRTRLLRDIDGRRLLLANAGSERRAGAHPPVALRPTAWGVLVNGTYDYVSLANVADLVLFSAPLAARDDAMFCVASLRADSVRIGDAKFGGNMWLSDTCAVTFTDHLVPPGRHLAVPNRAAMSCIAQYQRSWFQLLLVEVYLARVARLRDVWNLAASPADVANLNELALMKAYALRLLDEATGAAAISDLARVRA